MKQRPSLRERLHPEQARRDKHEIDPTREPSQGVLRGVVDEANKYRPLWQRDWNHVLDLVPAHDAAMVRTCGSTLVRFHNPKTTRDILVARRCRNYYCPTCPVEDHWARGMYHARKLASLDPTDQKPLPRVLNVVFTLPPILRAWVRQDPRVLPAWRKSILRTLAHAYGYEGTQGCPVERAAFQEMGAIMNLHAIGDEAQPWPKWAPHYDIIIPAWKREGDKIVPLRVSWPEPFKHTRLQYRVELRRALSPLTLAPTLQPEVADFLQTDFETDWHVSRPPKTPSNPDRKSLVHVESAMHRIRYSCRPLFVLQQARLHPGDVLAYKIETLRKRHVMTHTVPLRPALGQLESIREWMTGRHARSQVGILSKRSYDATARLAGHEPIRERTPRGLTHKATYELGPDRQFHKTTHRNPTPVHDDPE